MNEIFQNLYEMTAFSNIIAEPQFLIMYAIAVITANWIFSRASALLVFCFGTVFAAFRSGHRDNIFPFIVV